MGFKLMLIALLVGALDAHTVEFMEDCFAIPMMANLEIERITNKSWRVMSQSETKTSCFTYGFNRIPDSDFLLYVNKTRQVWEINNLIGSATAYTREGIISVSPEISTPEKMSIDWELHPIDRDFVIVDTDYETFMLIYECDVSIGVKTESAAVLSPSKKMDADTLQGFKNVFRDFGLDTNNLDDVNQENCNDPAYDITMDGESMTENFQGFTETASNLATRAQQFFSGLFT